MPAPVTPLGRPLLAIYDSRAPPTRSLPVFVGKQFLGLESKSGWLGWGDVASGPRVIRASGVKGPTGGRSLGLSTFRSVGLEGQEPAFLPEARREKSSVCLIVF